MSETQKPYDGTNTTAPPQPPADPTAAIPFEDCMNGNTSSVLQKWQDEHDAAIRKFNHGVTENNPAPTKGYKTT